MSSPAPTTPSPSTTPSTRRLRPSEFRGLSRQVSFSSRGSGGRGALRRPPFSAFTSRAHFCARVFSRAQNRVVFGFGRVPLPGPRLAGDGVAAVRLQVVVPPTHPTQVPEFRRSVLGETDLVVVDL